MNGCDIKECGEPILAEGVCYDHAKACSRCDGPSRVGMCEDEEACGQRLIRRLEDDALARGEECTA